MKIDLSLSDIKFIYFLLISLFGESGSLKICEHSLFNLFTQVYLTELKSNWCTRISQVGRFAQEEGLSSTTTERSHQGN